MNQVKIGSFLKTLRKEKQVTQEQLAEILNVSQRTISRWETGANMPDISLLTELADFYDVSIPEIIDGRRKSEDMNEEIKTTAEKMADYATVEKETIIKNVRVQGIIGACALVLYFIMDHIATVTQNVTVEKVSMYFETLVFVTVLLILFYTTNLLYKRRRTSNWLERIPQPIRFFVAIIMAIVVAVIIKLVINLF